ncbi:MAG: hypothetical protein MZV49_25140 [Rhodopseudomonas palustris]|nr:hypothetical protein [Rhodopseudomonas palustris]
MIAPPVNVPVMIIGGGIDMPYVGFGLVLAVLTIVPADPDDASGWRGAGSTRAKLAEVVAESRADVAASAFRGGRRLLLYLPLAAVIVLMVGPKSFPQWFPDPRLPLTFLIGSRARRCHGAPRAVAVRGPRPASSEILPVVGILVGVGMLIEMHDAHGPPRRHRRRIAGDPERVPVREHRR